MVCDHTCQKKKKKKNAEDIEYLKAAFPKITEKKLMKSLLVRPQKKAPHKDKNYIKTLVLNFQIRNHLSGSVKIFCVTRDAKILEIESFFFYSPLKQKGF